MNAINIDTQSAIENLIYAYNAEVREHDRLVETLEVQDRQIASYKRDIESLIDHADSQSSEIGWLQVDNNKLIAKVQGLEKEVAELRQNQQKENKLSKRENAQINRLKESSAKYQSRCKIIERDLKESNQKRHSAVEQVHVLIQEVKSLQEKLAEYRLTPIYQEDGEILVCMPFLIATSVDGGKEKEVYTLLYSRNGGIFRQVTLDRHHSIGFGMMRKPMDSKYSEKSYDLANNLLDEPSDKVKQLATKWLYKVNVTQKGRILFEDINLNTP